MSFIHAAFLAASLAVAVPWLLHLTKRRKYLKIRLGSLQFLDPIVRDRHRMSRIEQWPLLIARCLAVLLLALVFARPYFPKPSQAPPVTGEALILLDASGSITGKQADAIRKQAAKLVAGLPASARPVIAAVSDQVEILPSLDAYQPIAGSPTGYGHAVDWVVDRATSSPNSIAAVHWFTDLQRSPLPAAPSRLWPSGLSAEVHTVLPPSDCNVAVEQVDLLTPFGGDHWEMEARVRVYGMPGTDALNLVLTTADGKQVTATTPAEGGTAHFTWEGNAKENLLTGDIAVVRSGDAWPADDRRPFAFSVTEPKRIHLVDGDPGDSPFLSETYFLEKALHASSAGKVLSPFRATVSTSLPATSEKVDVIALCNVPGLTSDNVRQLQGFLDRGTGLVIFLGDQTQPSSWSPAIGAGLFPPGLRAFPEASPAFIRRTDLNQAGLAGLNRESARNLELVALMKRFTWPADAAWVNGMEFDDDTPLIAFSIKSKIAVIAHPANREGSDFPLNPAFVSLVQGLFGQMAKPVDGKAAGDGQQPPLQITPGIHERRAPGIYDAEGRSAMVAADVTESDIANADEKSFRKQLGLPASDAPPPALIPPVTQPDSTHQREGELWPWLVATLLALLTLESVLAARRIRSSATPDAHAN